MTCRKNKKIKTSIKEQRTEINMLWGLIKINSYQRCYSQEQETKEINMPAACKDCRCWRSLLSRWLQDLLIEILINCLVPGIFHQEHPVICLLIMIAENYTLIWDFYRCCRAIWDQLRRRP